MAESLQPTTVSVDRSGRIVIPQSWCAYAGWIHGTDPLNAWLLMGELGRYRLLSDADVEAHSTLRGLRAKISESNETTKSDLIEFEDEAFATLPLRLASVQLSPPRPGWRLTLPRAITTVMDVRPGEDEVALLISKGHIEIWAIEKLKSALRTPLADIA
jgi:hypothetical protein